MLLQPDCILCLLKVSLMAIRELTPDERRVRELMSLVVNLPFMRRPEWTTMSPQLFEKVFLGVSSSFDDRDPFEVVKERQNRKGLELYPWLKGLVSRSNDPVFTAVNLAIIGNSLDVNWSGGSVEVEPIIESKLKRPVSSPGYEEFIGMLEQARRVVYLTDNAGEIVFDKLLIETMRQSADPEVVCVVKSVPVLNDATMSEARIVGLDQVATVVENGIDGPVPGTILARCSDDVRRLIEEADLIISKGGGNFDTLDEEVGLDDRLFFMLMCKCVPYCTYFSAKLYEPILSRPIRGERRRIGHNSVQRRDHASL